MISYPTQNAAGIAAEYWTKDLPFEDERQKHFFVEILKNYIFEQIKDRAKLLEWWQVHIECYPRRNWVHPDLKETAKSVGFHQDIFLLRPDATMMLGHQGIQISENFGVWQFLLEVKREGQNAIFLANDESKEGII